ncbi:MAG: OmpA family protein [Polyangia bacterium]
MQKRRSFLGALSVTTLALFTGSSLAPRAAAANGFSLERYEPTTAGEQTLATDHPWYSSTRWFAAGLTLDYARKPLVYGTHFPDNSFKETGSIIKHGLYGHLDLAGSFLDRVTIALSVPVALYEKGTTIDGVSPLGGAAVGDPRLGVMVRAVGQPDRSPFSLNLGVAVWIPTHQDDHHIGDRTARVEPKIVLAGLASSIRWSLTGAYQYRPKATIGNDPPASGNNVGSELQFGALIQYANLKYRFAIGPEAQLATVVSDHHGFARSYTSLEILGGAHYNIAEQVQVSVGAGVGLLREPGTPDARVIVRAAYAPIRHLKQKKLERFDRDNDGIYDTDDHCPDVRGVASADPIQNGCPSDRDHDGVIDAPVALDLCPDVAQGEHPDPKRRGCPQQDRDHDGVFDEEDLCPDVSAGPRADRTRLGCPAIDTDHDGVYDDEDLCVDVPAGDVPDPKKLGCPLPDRDHDRIADDVDACPDKPGAPSTDPKKNGCPGLVKMQNGMIVILQPLYFATNKDVILPRSFPVLLAVADALKAQPEIKRLAIEGHTDDRGKAEHNLDLSQRRAASVEKYLTSHGVEADRLESHGYGMTRPVTTNKTNAGRATNRRVDFRVVDPAAPPQAN